VKLQHLLTQAVGEEEAAMMLERLRREVIEHCKRLGLDQRDARIWKILIEEGESEIDGCDKKMETLSMIETIEGMEQS